VNAIGYFSALMNLLFSAFFGKVRASENPYNSLSLEWKTASPPITENFTETPVVTDWTYGYGTPVEGPAH
jgi:cytochrome c oxidase subunit 1